MVFLGASQTEAGLTAPSAPTSGSFPSTVAGDSSDWEYPWFEASSAQDSFFRTHFGVNQNTRLAPSETVDATPRCPRAQGRVPPGELNPDRLDVCPKCLCTTLHKVDNYFGAHPPTGDQMEILGASPVEFERIHGRRCTWTLFKWACPCSSPLMWWWSYLMHSESIEGKCFPMSSSLSLMSQARGASAQHTSGQPLRNNQGARMSQSRTVPTPNQAANTQHNTSSFSFSYNSFDGRDEAWAPAISAEDELSTGAYTSRNPSPYLSSPQTYVSASDHDSPTDQVKTRRTSLKPSSNDTAQTIRVPSRRRPHPRVIKDPWKYAFHHRYGACQDCRASRCQCSPEHLDEEILHKVPLSRWLERPYPGWRPSWVPQSIQPTKEDHDC